MADYTEAIRLDPGDPRPYNNRGNLRLSSGDVAGAVADFTDAVRADPRFYLGYLNRALAWKTAGDVERAIADYRRALEVAPPTWSRRVEIERFVATLRGGRDRTD